MLKIDDAMKGAYEEIPPAIDVGVAKDVIDGFPEFNIGAVIQGSSGSEEPKLHEVLLDNEFNGKLSFIFRLELSNFSCLLHFALLFWNQTYKNKH